MLMKLNVGNEKYISMQLLLIFTIILSSKDKIAAIGKLRDETEKFQILSIKWNSNNYWSNMEGEEMQKV